MRIAALLIVTFAFGCGSRGAEAAVELHYAANTPDPALVSHEIVDAYQWAEHGASCRVREVYADGRVEEVRLEVVRECGEWRVGER